MTDGEQHSSDETRAADGSSEVAAGPPTRGAVPRGLSADRLSLVVAICAILVSLASFYATYLQADSARKQVKAMTLPLLQFSHGNFDEATQKLRISFVLKNAGVGPAIIKSAAMRYRGEDYYSSADLFEACCPEEWERFKSEVLAVESEDRDIHLSSPLVNAIIPGQTDYRFLSIEEHEAGKDFWHKLDKERWSLRLSICFCSLLDECYLTEEVGLYTEVDQCPATRFSR